jgi:plastocyanin
MRRFPPPLLLLLLCTVAAVGVAACGGDDDGGGDTAATTTETTDTTATEEGAGGGGAASVIRISADPGGDLAFEQKSVDAKAGENKIEFENPASIPHDVKVEEDGNEIGGTDVVTDSTAEATVQLDAGQPYTFFCSVPGHRQAGMEGEINVR